MLCAKFVAKIVLFTTYNNVIEPMQRYYITYTLNFTDRYRTWQVLAGLILDRPGQNVARRLDAAHWKVSCDIMEIPRIKNLSKTVNSILKGVSAVLIGNDNEQYFLYQTIILFTPRCASMFSTFAATFVETCVQHAWYTVNKTTNKQFWTLLIKY